MKYGVRRIPAQSPAILRITVSYINLESHYYPILSKIPSMQERLPDCRTIIIVGMIGLFSITAAQASPIAYNIGFTQTGGSGLVPSRGTFFYDSGASLGSAFSLFHGRLGRQRD